MKEVRNYREGQIVSVSVYDVSEYPMHYHCDPEIIMVIKGAAKIHTSFYEIECINENEFIFINGNTIHNIEKRENEPCRIMSIHFYMADIARLYGIQEFTALSIASFDEYSSPKIISQLRKYLTDIALRFFSPQADMWYSLSDTVMECYTYMLNNFQWFYYDDYILHNYPQRLPLSQINRAEEVITYMHEHYSEKLTLTKVAKAFFLNKYYLSHLLKDTMGMSFQEMLNAIRLNAALYPILETTRSIDEIAENCGFSSAAYLRKAFMTHGKRSLSRYRKKYIKRTLRDRTPDIEEFNDSQGLEILMEYKKKYYPEYFVAENITRIPIHVKLKTPKVLRSLDAGIRSLKITPATLLYTDKLRETFEVINFVKAVVMEKEFVQLRDRYGETDVLEPVRRLCREFDIVLETKGFEEGDERIEPAVIVGGKRCMYGRNGLRTKHYYLRFLLSSLYNEVVFEGSSCIITKRDKELAVLCSNLNPKGSDLNAERKEIFLRLEDIECNYSIMTYSLKMNEPDEVELWESMGCPDDMGQALMETIRSCCFPKVSHVNSTAQYDLLRDIILEPEEVKLIMLKPVT